MRQMMPSCWSIRKPLGPMEAGLPLPFLSVKVPAPTATWVGKPVIFVYWGVLNVCKEKI